MEERKERCATCRFWDVSEQDNPVAGRVDLGECQRFPPSIVLAQTPIMLQAEEYPEEAKENASYAVWPVTRDWDWCGEWQAKEPT
jgi:hypothetical protein